MKFRKTLPALLLLACLSLTSHGQTIRRLDKSKMPAEALTKNIERLMQAADVQGLAVSVFNKNKPVYQRTFGYKRMDTKEPLAFNTVFYGASLSKAVFAVLVLKLVEEGVLDLDTPLANYLPKAIHAYGTGESWNQDFTDLKNDPLYEKITARMCLNHTSGFPNWRWNMPDQKLKVRFEPGTRYSYSGEGFCYLQFVLEQLTGKGLEELMTERIYQPLNMQRTSYTWQPRFEENYCDGHGEKGEIFPKDKDNAARSASTLETTLQDYSNFMAGVMQDKVLKAASTKEMFSPQIRIRSKKQMGPLAWQDTTANDHINLSYGLGWGYFDTPYGPGVFKEGHYDGGFQHYSIIFPEQKTGILIMSNSNNAEKIFKELLQIAIADTYTPWEWENYIPYNFVEK